MRISRGMTVPGHMAGEMKSESTKAGTKKSLRNSRERSPRARSTHAREFQVSDKVTKKMGSPASDDLDFEIAGSA